jgi:hypothetical protein
LADLKPLLPKLQEAIAEARRGVPVLIGEG